MYRPQDHLPPRTPTAKSNLARLLAAALLAALAGCVAGWAHYAYVDDRFAHHAVVADALILDSDVGCLGASGGDWSTSGAGSGGGFGETVTYRVQFTYRGELHTTSVTKGCRVIPPDFGRGRGAIWVEYDADDPDRIRVLTDDTAAQRVRWCREGALSLLAAGLVVLVARRSRQTSMSDRRRSSLT